ncbi:MAG: biotin/lipoyl-containing protein [Clostridiaceae bacterium]
MIYEVTINNKKYEVEVEKGQAAIIGTKEASAPVAVAMPQVTAAAAQVVAPATINVGSGEVVKAPMPGTILDIKVSAGSRIKKGDVLFILEAMKMENEIVAPADGAVAQIKAVKGSTVNTGDVLAVIQ